MFGKAKKIAAATKDITHGSNIEYKVGNEWHAGVVHSIREIDTKSGTKITSYLVDNGKVALTQEVVTPKGEDNLVFDQPQQIEVAPDSIRLAE